MYSFRKNKIISIRVDDIVDKMIRRLCEEWDKSTSDVVRYCIVYTYVKYLLKGDKSVSIEDIENAINDVLQNV